MDFLFVLVHCTLCTFYVTTFSQLNLDSEHLVLILIPWRTYCQLFFQHLVDVRRQVCNENDEHHDNIFDIHYLMAKRCANALRVCACKL